MSATVSFVSEKSEVSRRKGTVISAEPRINDRIRVAEVRLIGYDGEKIGVVSIDTALKMAD